MFYISSYTENYTRSQLLYVLFLGLQNYELDFLIFIWLTIDFLLNDQKRVIRDTLKTKSLSKTQPFYLNIIDYLNGRLIKTKSSLFGNSSKTIMKSLFSGHVAT